MDRNALLLRSDEPNFLIGYVAKYYGAGLDSLLVSNGNEVVVTVKQVNADAPLDMRLLCTLTAPWVDDFRLLESENDFAPWSQDEAVDDQSGFFQNTSLLLG